VWDTPRVIGCAENFPQQIALPRGCLDAASQLLRGNGIALNLLDERMPGTTLLVNFPGTLRLDQEAAVSAMLHHETGVLSAPTAFGKTVLADSRIARRAINTLVLVHRVELLKQWRGQMSAKQRDALIAQLNALPPQAARVLLSTGKLVGEGFDHAPLDTLVLAMPVSWKGTL
jgi:superfamily II DNA or RNA helicase